MRKAKFNRYLTGLAVVLSLTMIQSVTLSYATTKPPVQRSSSTVVSFDKEVRVLEGFMDDWASVFKQQGVLSKRAAITSPEFDTFKSS